MNRHLIYFPILLIVLVFFTLSLMTIIEESFINSAIAEVDPSQEQIEPIPQSNNTNTNQTTPIVFSR